MRFCVIARPLIRSNLKPSQQRDCRARPDKSGLALNDKKWPKFGVLIPERLHNGNLFDVVADPDETREIKDPDVHRGGIQKLI